MLSDRITIVMDLTLNSRQGESCRLLNVNTILF